MDSFAGMPVTDDGKRLANAVLVARAGGGEGRWVAVRLSDGATDGAVYDTRQDAIRHQLHEDQCCYLVVPPTAMPPHEATGYLDFNRRRVAAGVKMIDPEQAAPAPPMLYVPNRATRRGTPRRVNYNGIAAGVARRHR